VVHGEFIPTGVNDRFGSILYETQHKRAAGYLSRVESAMITSCTTDRKTKNED